MAAADTRKLKDSVTEYLKKGKWEKAATTLEALIKAEPKEMQHRLKLGDALRKLGDRDRAIAAYETAARVYGDEGQLLKAIAAVKVILEIDPRNQVAQKHLSEMNDRRFMKPGQFLTPKAAAPKAIGARAVSAIELEEGNAATAAVAGQLNEATTGAPFKRSVEAIELPPDEPAPPSPPAEPRRQATSRRGPAISKEFDSLDPALLPEGDQELVEVEPEQELAEFDVAASKAAPPDDVEIELIEVDAEPGTEPIKVQGTAGKKAPPPPDEIELDVDLGARKPKTGPQPIADLLTSGDEGEIELLSISTDQEAAAPPAADASVEELDAAFGNIVDEHARKTPRRVPTRVPLFDELGRDAFIELVNKLDYRVYQPGDLILREGDPGRSFFVISEGRVRVYKTRTDGTELQLATLEEGAFFGEMAMLSGAPRTASVAAEIETAVLEVTDKVVRQLVARHPSVTATLKNFYRQRLVNNVMAISPLFKDFDSAERKALMERFRMRQAKAGEVLVEQGKKSDGLYVVLHGAVTVSVNAMNGDVDLARLKEGDIFGEGSMLTREPATATVVAAVPSIVLKLPRDQFQEMISTHPQVLELVSELTDKRRSATEAILKGQGPGVDGMAFV